MKESEILDIAVACQEENLICGPLSVSDDIRLTYATSMRQGPIIASQELIEWLTFREPNYLLNFYRKMKRTKDGHSILFSLIDLFN